MYVLTDTQIADLYRSTVLLDLAGAVADDRQRDTLIAVVRDIIGDIIQEQGE